MYESSVQLKGRKHAHLAISIFWWRCQTVAKRVPLWLPELAPAVSWRDISGMRDNLAHDYLGVDLDLIWDVVASELPATRTHIVTLLEEVEHG
jgi:uncharacterized protein with HEPN domain